jgi:hypothetical protein
MKDFGRWMLDQPILHAPELTPAELHIVELEEAGVIDVMQDGRYMARCCRCGRDDELPVGPDEINLDYQHYCHGSPRCCP